ncbi:MAG: hypothetical protein MMC23_004872 [Stictis urceolatum]|nr:hypothetical protein [Stictis urceolata]
MDGLWTHANFLAALLFGTSTQGLVLAFGVLQYSIDVSPPVLIASIGATVNCAIFFMALVVPYILSYELLRIVLPSGSLILVVLLLCSPWLHTFVATIMLEGIFLGIVTRLVFAAANCMLRRHFIGGEGEATRVLAASGALGGLAYSILWCYLIPSTGYDKAMRLTALLTAIPLFIANLLWRERPDKPLTASRSDDWTDFTKWHGPCGCLGLFLLFFGLLNGPFFGIPRGVMLRQEHIGTEGRVTIMMWAWHAGSSLLQLIYFFVPIRLLPRWSITIHVALVVAASIVFTVQAGSSGSQVTIALSVMYCFTTIVFSNVYKGLLEGAIACRGKSKVRLWCFGALLLPNHGQLEAIYFSMLPSIITLVVGAGMIALASMSPEVTSSGRLTAQA